MSEQVPMMPGLVAQGTLIEAAARRIMVHVSVPGHGIIEGYVAGLDESYMLLFALDRVAVDEWTVYIVSRLYLTWLDSRLATLNTEDVSVQEQYMTIAGGFVRQAEEILRRLDAQPIKEDDE